MKVGYHAAVQKDVNCILSRYDAVSRHLGDEFWNELQPIIETAAATPLPFHAYIGDLRRANLAVTIQLRNRATIWEWLF